MPDMDAAHRFFFRTPRLKSQLKQNKHDLGFADQAEFDRAWNAIAAHINYRQPLPDESKADYTKLTTNTVLDILDIATYEIQAIAIAKLTRELVKAIWD